MPLASTSALNKLATRDGETPQWHSGSSVSGHDRDENTGWHRSGNDKAISNREPCSPESFGSFSGYARDDNVNAWEPSSTSDEASISQRLPTLNVENVPPPCTEPGKANERSVGWRDLPNKKQLAILTFARLSEPLTQTSLRAYMYYQVKSFDPRISDSTVASQVGILEGSFAAAQFLTAMAWGRAADSNWCGRKMVLLIGLSGTCISCVGFGFSRSFWQATTFRFLGGALNGNVGVMRTMISEIVKEKKYGEHRIYWCQS